MSHRAFVGTLLLGWALLIPRDADAQRQRDLSFDASIGWGRTHTSGEYTADRDSPVAEALLALSFREAGRGGIVTGLNLDFHPGAWGHDDICIQLPTGECKPHRPGFAMVGALAGWENANATLRAMAGPVYARGDADGTLGLRGRLDGALPVFSHLSLVATARGTVIPRYRGDSFHLVAFGLGARIH